MPPSFLSFIARAGSSTPGIGSSPQTPRRMEQEESTSHSVDIGEDEPKTPPTATHTTIIKPATEVSSAPSSSPFSFVIDDQFRIDKMVAALFASASGRQRWCLICYDHSLPIAIGLQLFLVIMFLLIDPEALQWGESITGSMEAITIIIEIIQVFITICAHLGMFREIQALYVRPNKIWNMYCSTIMCFGAWYFMFFAMNPLNTFVVDGYAPTAQPDAGIPGIPTDPESDTQNYNDVPSVYLFFIYFSAAIMTSTGFGDIAPRLWHTQLLTNVQMIVGTMYHVGVFGLTLSHFRTLQRAVAPLQAKSMTDKMLSKIQSHALYVRIQAHPLTAKIKHWSIQHLLIISIGFQLIITLLMFAINDPFETVQPGDAAYTRKYVVIAFVGLVQFGEFCMVVFTSVRLVRDVNNKEVTAGFLLQSYLATALLFGGIYFVLFTATPNHEFYRNNRFNLSIFEVLYVFVHFSFTIITTTGFGDVYARGALSRTFVFIEMLICILYNAVIIGMGTSQLIDMQAAKAEAQFVKATASASASATPSHPDDEPIIEEEQSQIDQELEQQYDEHSVIDSHVPLTHDEHDENLEEYHDTDYDYVEEPQHEEEDPRNLRMG